jgi:hypothetical protein
MSIMFHDTEIARRDGGVLVIRPAPVRVRFEITELTTHDGHRVNGGFAASVRALSDRAEKAMLEETFLASSQTISTDDVADHFQSTLRAAAQKHAGSVEAADLLADAGKTALVDRLAKAAQDEAFKCGLEVVPPFSIDLESPTLRQQQFEAMQRQAAERRAADQMDHLSRSAQLFKKFQEIRQSAPELTAGQVLQQVAPADQAEMLRSLLLASAKESGQKSLWAVAGPYLVKISAGDSAASPQAQLIPLPETLGPLRSVQAATYGGETMLLVGARGGVLKVDPAKPDATIAYSDPSVVSAMGFNSAVIHNGELWASHGEAGLVCWTLGDPAKPRLTIRPADSAIKPFAPKQVSSLDDSRLLVATSDRLCVVMPDGTLIPQTLEPRAGIVAMVREDGHVIVIHEDGQLCRRDAQTLAMECETRRTGRLTAAAALPWLGTHRVLLATEDGPIHCVGFDDELTTQYVSPHRGLRVAAAAPDLVAAISADRQRIVLWPSWDGRKPAGEIHLGGLAKHRVADIDFG